MSKACLIFSDGSIYEGTRFGADRDAVCEVVFATGSTGYVELLTDPSFCGQAVTLTHPIVGNYGVFEDVSESERLWVGALIIRDLTEVEGDERGAEDFDAYLKRNGVPGLYGVDTREIVLKIREEGTKVGAILSGEAKNVDMDAAMEMIKAYDARHLVPEVSPKEVTVYPAWHQGWDENKINSARQTNKRSDIALPQTESLEEKLYKVAFLDFGAKKNIIWNLTMRGCEVLAFPWDTDADTILGQKPDGIFLSNGPGNPEHCGQAIEEIKKLIETGIPVMGICLGHQLISLALGAKTHKLKYGHRGANHPVKELESNRIYITSQNHSFVVEEDSLPSERCVVSHVNVNDGTVEGQRARGASAFSVQYHPEGAPGPHDPAPLFQRFRDLMARGSATRVSREASGGPT